MSRFFVGMRVRIVNLTANRQREGCAACIYACGFSPRHRQLGPGFYYWCDVEGYGKQNGGALFAYAEWQLEPILPEGQQPTTWSECLWRPDGSHKTEKVAEEGRAIALRSIL